LHGYACREVGRPRPFSMFGAKDGCVNNPAS
jgi:hypothetical protein